jgi:hypothetical protein
MKASIPLCENNEELFFKSQVSLADTC